MSTCAKHGKADCESCAKRFGTPEPVALTGVVETSEPATAETKSHADEIEYFERNRGNLLKQVEELGKELEAEREMCGQLRKQAEGCEMTIWAFQKDLEAEQEAKKKLAEIIESHVMLQEQDKKDFIGQIDSLKRKRGQLQKQLEDSEQALTASLEKKGKVVTQLEKARAKIERLETKLVDLNANKKELQSDLRTSRRTEKQLRADLAKKDIELEDMKPEQGDSEVDGV